ncbi:MAG: hypothetical protein EZS28_043010, partial [Streblomastix strix]
CELPSSNNYYTATSGGDQCDLNLSPVQSGRQITELLAAMEIDTPVRQNTERHCAYLEKPRQCAHPRSPETQDRVQRRLRSTFEFIQDYLVRTGRRRHNPGPGLFRQVLEPIFAIPKKKGGWRKILDCRILNSVLQTEYFKLEGITDIQEIVLPNDWATTIDLHQAFHHI